MSGPGRPAKAPAAAAGASWTLDLPDYLPPSVNRLLTCHWAEAARIKRATTDLVRAYALRQGVPGATGRRRVSLTLTVTNRAHSPDADNVLKCLLDALVQAGLLVDDRAEFCELGKIEILKGSRKHTAIVLENLGPASGRSK